MDWMLVTGGITLAVGALLWVGGRAWGRSVRAKNAKRYGHQ